MVKTASAISKSSEQRRGVQSTSFKFSPEERELLARLEAVHGGRKGAIIAGLRAIDRGGDISNAELLAMLARRLKAGGQ